LWYKVSAVFQKLLKAAAGLFVCKIIPDPRIIGTFVSDKDATLAYMQSSGEFTEQQLKLFSGLLGKLKLECDGVTVVSTMDDHTDKEPLHIIKSTNDYIIIKSLFLGKPFQSKVIFTEDGYWQVGSGALGPEYREKFVRIGHPIGEAEQNPVRLT